MFTRRFALQKVALFCFCFLPSKIKAKTFFFVIESWLLAVISRKFSCCYSSTSSLFSGTVCSFFIVLIQFFSLSLLRKQLPFSAQPSSFTVLVFLLFSSGAIKLTACMSRVIYVADLIFYFISFRLGMSRFLWADTAATRHLVTNQRDFKITVKTSSSPKLFLSSSGSHMTQSASFILRHTFLLLPKGQPCRLYWSMHILLQR